MKKNSNYTYVLSLLQTTHFHIYGTGIVGVSIYIALKELYNLIPVSFFVTALEDNPAQIEQIPVEEVGRAALDGDLILVATPVEHHKAIGQTMEALGVSKGQICYVDSVLEDQIMETYYAHIPGFETAKMYMERKQDVNGVKSLQGTADCCQQDILIYQAKCHVDRILSHGEEKTAYISPIQVGAALTEQSITELKDNTGDNISWKNRDYCELTATYHAWKNSNAAYKGLCHYRRVFTLKDSELVALLNGVDAILPYPTIHIPNIMNQHERYVSEAEWQAMRQAIIEYEPSYAADFNKIFSDRYFYNFNMLVAKAEIFDDYARWMFGILERTEQIIAREGIIATKRYAGYLGENLTTLYFRSNRERIRIVHAGKVHLV